MSQIATKKSTRKETLSAANRRFHALPKNEKAVAVAKDVLKQLKAETIQPLSRNGYVEINEHYEDYNVKFDQFFQESAKTGKKEICTVCGIGACMVSFANLGDKFTTGQLDDTDADAIHSKLRTAFTKSQLGLIERAFESTFSDIGDDKAQAFGGRYGDDTARLTAIMKNIIKNNGVFKP